VILTGSILYAATDDGIYKSTDFASSWVKKSDGIVVGNGAIYAFAESIYELNGTLFTGTYTGLYRSTNGGDNWLPTNISNGMHIWAKNFTLHNGIIFAARESGNSPNGYKSTDNGLTWQTISPFPHPSITFLSEPGKLFMGTIHGAWLSADNGISWSERSAGLSADPYNSGFVRANGILVTSLKFGGSGMYKSTNDGIEWTNWKDGLPFLISIDKIVLFSNKILAGTSAGIYQRDISELTGISMISSQIPNSFSLKQNYPNPFNPSTKIRFDLPAQSNVVMNIYDITGREAAAVVNSDLSAGSYEVTFDASQLAAGVYFYRIQAGEYSDTKKMIIVK
jgi:hypothetical protein